MPRLIEFAGNHFYLISAAAVMAVVVIVSEIRARIQDFAAIAPTDAIRLMNQGAVVIDLREPAEYQAGHISEARNFTLQNLTVGADALKKYREKPVIACCNTGINGGSAARELSKLGFSRVFNLRGGLNAWRQENLPLVRSSDKLGAKAEQKTDQKLDPTSDDKSSGRKAQGGPG
jgi:rhodanese-related sulfurtransferase